LVKLCHINRSGPVFWDTIWRPWHRGYREFTDTVTWWLFVIEATRNSLTQSRDDCLDFAAKLQPFIDRTVVVSRRDIMSI